MDQIIVNGQRVALVYRKEDWKPGLHFPTLEEDFLQVGCWYYNKEKKLSPHRHKTYERIVMKTQEMVYVIKGKVLISIFTDMGEMFKEIILNTNDFAILFHGGHGYEVLEDETQVLEVKNGPFISVKHDKEML